MIKTCLDLRCHSIFAPFHGIGTIIALTSTLLKWEIGCCKRMRNLEGKFAITDTNGAGVDVGPTESSKEAPKAMVIPWSSPPFTDHLLKPCSTALSDVGHHLDPGQPLSPALSTVQTQASNTVTGWKPGWAVVKPTRHPIGNSAVRMPCGNHPPYCTSY